MRLKDFFNKKYSKEEKRNFWLFLLFSSILVILDQITKLAVKGFNLFGIKHIGMELGESHQFIGDVVRITFVENAGMAFGIEFGVWKILLSLFSIIASILLIIYLYNIIKFSSFVKLGVSFILAGAFGNWIDRMFYGVFFGESPLFYGRVVDFIQVDIPDIDLFGLYYTHWPVFNFADSYVTIGVGILLIFNSKIPDFKELFSFEKGKTEEGEN